MMTNCSVEHCLNAAIAKGLCRSHYAAKAYRDRVASDPVKMQAARERKKARRSQPRAYAMDRVGEFRQSLRKFGIGTRDYAAMLVEQGRVCAICERENTPGKRLAVDHCHTTGRVRGLLCDNCNQALGKFKDSPALLRTAARYLEKPARYFEGPDAIRRGQKPGRRSAHSQLTAEQVRIVRAAPRGARFDFCSRSISSRIRTGAIYRYVP